MNDNDIRKAFLNLTEGTDASRVTDAVKAEIKPAAVRKHRLKLPRYVFAAAALMVALAVSAGAYAVYRQLTIETPDSGAFDYIVHIDGGENGETEMITLSEEIVEALDKYKAEKTNLRQSGDGFEFGLSFDTWQDAADWLDCGIMTSDILGDVPEDLVFMNGDGVTLYANYNSEGELVNIQLSCNNEIKDSELSCWMNVTIPLSGKWEQYSTAVSITGEMYIDENGRLTVGDTHDPSATEVITYEAANGITAEITTTRQINGAGEYSSEWYDVSGYIFNDSIIYQFIVHGPEKDAAVEAVKAIADSLK